MNPLRRLNRLRFGSATLLVAGLMLLLTNPGGWRAETQTISLQLASATLPPATSARVTLVNIDRASLTEAGAWPWPRTQIAQLIQAVAGRNAETVLVVLPLEGADAAAPQRAVEAWGATGGGRDAQAALARLPDTNAVLLDILEQNGAILGLYPGRGGAGISALAEVTFDQEAGRGFLPSIGVRTEGPLAGAAPLRIPLALRRDFLGRPTGAYLIGTAGEAILPTAATLALLARTDEPVRVQSNGAPGNIAFTDPVGIEEIGIGGHAVPALADGSILLRRDIRVPLISALQILNGDGQNLISGRMVVIGSMLDEVNGEPAALAPGLSAAHAIALSAAQVASGRSPARPFLYTWIELLLALTIGAGILSLARRPWIAFGAALAAGGAMYGASVYLLTSQGALFDASAVTLVLIFVAAAGLLGAEGGIRSPRQRFAHAVQGKLPFGVPARLLRNPKSLLDVADSRKMTVLCCTIRGFEELQDLYKDDPQGLTAILHQFHEMVGERVRSLGGTADRYGGATILAFWNAPLEEPDHALKTCDCALRLVDGLERLNQNIEAQAYRHGKAYSPIHLGIGINTGRAVVGNVGSKRQPDYSAVGEAVAVAQKLLAASADYGPAIIVGEHTYQAVKNRFALLEVDKITIPHRTYAIRVFALLGNPVTKASPRFRALEDAHAEIFQAYRDQNWSLADALITECRKLNGAIPSLYDLYERRIDFYRHYPPDPEWDGAFSIPVV
ncbi:CHASE2 domain-containing protein [bacterium AH-315-P15]|nr:CHASE2 domain-containing protein [bacterium AH-315-P15]